MTPKDLYNKHLNLLTPKGWQSEKQIALYTKEATMNAIKEALELGRTK